MIRKPPVYYWEDVVIGSGVEAVSFAHRNNFHFIFNEVSPPYPWEREPAGESGAFNLTTPNSTIQVGEYKLEKFEELVIDMGLRGFSPFPSRENRIRIEDEYINVPTETAKLFKIHYKRLHIFNSRNIKGIERCIEEDKPQINWVSDWYDLRSGGNTKLDLIKNDSDFIKYLYFYPSRRVDNNYTKYGEMVGNPYKDLIAVSCLSEQEMTKDIYDCPVATLIVKRILKQHGFRGHSNGTRKDKDGNIIRNYLSVNIEHTDRLVRLGEKYRFRDGENIKFYGEISINKKKQV